VDEVHSGHVIVVAADADSTNDIALRGRFSCASAGRGTRRDAGSPDMAPMARWSRPAVRNDGAACARGATDYSPGSTRDSVAGRTSVRFGDAAVRLCAGPPNRYARIRPACIAPRCDDVVMPDDHDRVVAIDELTAEDLSALGWAFTTRHNAGTAEVDRVANGESGVRADVVAATRADWEAAGRPKADHHVHRTSVRLIDGTEVVGVTFVANDAYSRDAVPTFGLYLDERWKPPWAHSHVNWPDFGLPADTDALRAALQDVLDRARRDQRVELGCSGGHGRTGTALACLAVLAGTPASEAVAWVRENYCEKAVETAVQEAFVLGFDRGQP